MVLIVLTDPNPALAFNTLIRRCAYVLIPLSILLYKYFPDMGRRYHRYSGEMSIVGVTVGKNALGLLCMITALLFCWHISKILKKKKMPVVRTEILVHGFILAMIFWLFINVDSATATGTFVIGIGIFLGTGTQIFKNNINGIGAFLIIMVLFYLISEWLFGVTGIAISTMGRDPTLTGRTLLWKDIIDMSNNFLFGTGYDSFWLGERRAKLWEMYWWHPTEAHNGYIETYIELGFIGLTILIGIIVSGFKNLIRSFAYDFDFGRLRIAFFIIALVFNVTESGFKGLHLMWFIFLITVVECHNNKSSLKNEKLLR